MMNGGYSEVYGPFTTAQMVEWHEMGCFVSNPLIRRVEKKGTTTSTSDFDAAFEEDDANVTSSSQPWIAANDIDYFENCNVFSKQTTHKQT